MANSMNYSTRHGYNHFAGSILSKIQFIYYLFANILAIELPLPQEIIVFGSIFLHFLILSFLLVLIRFLFPFAVISNLTMLFLCVTILCECDSPFLHQNIQHSNNRNGNKKQITFNIYLLFIDCV